MAANGGKAAAIALLVNVRSRLARKEEDFVARLSAAFGDRGPLVLLKQPGELPQVMQDLFRARPEIVCLCGGDGTLRQTLTHLTNAYGRESCPRIAILRGGTMNTVATSLRIRRHPVAHLRSLLQRIDANLPLAATRRHLLKVNQHYGFIFAIGGFSRFIEMYAEKEDPTPLYGFGLLSRTFLSSLVGGPLASMVFKQINVHIWRDGQPWLSDTPVTNVAASSVRHIGFNFKPFYGAEGPAGEFGLLVLRSSPRRLILHALKLYRGEPVSDPEVLQLPAREVLIKLKRPVRPMLDGDFLRITKEIALSAGPALEMVTG